MNPVRQSPYGKADKSLGIEDIPRLLGTPKLFTEASHETSA
jgi:hypothetical protein